MRILQTANLGFSMSGLSGSVRYALYDTLGNEVSSSKNTGIYEIGTSTGVYGVELNIGNRFSGSILWSVNGKSGVFATEEVKSDQRMARMIHTGRWLIDKPKAKMTFFEEDNITPIAVYDLKDTSGNPSVTEVFERVYSGSGS